MILRTKNRLLRLFVLYPVPKRARDADDAMRHSGFLSASARESVTSSAYSMSLPMDMPLAIFVTLMPIGLMRRAI